MKVKDLMSKINDCTPISTIGFSVDGRVTDSGYGKPVSAGKHYVTEYIWFYDHDFWDNRAVNDFMFTAYPDGTVALEIDCKPLRNRK